MAHIELAPAVLEDFDRFLAHLTKFDVGDSPGRIEYLIETLDVLSHSPLIGRKAGDGGLRELVIGQGARGYVALYTFVQTIDTVFVLAVRHQRERGYGRDV